MASGSESTARTIEALRRDLASAGASLEPDGRTIMSASRRRAAANKRRMVLHVGLFVLGLCIGIAIVFAGDVEAALRSVLSPTDADLHDLRPSTPRVAVHTRKSEEPSITDRAPPTLDFSDLPSSTITVDVAALPPASTVEGAVPPVRATPKRRP